MIAQIPKYIEAILLTLKIAGISIILSIGIGLICALIYHYKPLRLHGFTQLYIEVSRNTPLLIQLFFLYYGLPKIGLVISEFDCAIIGLSFLGGGYMSEAFRSGIEAVDSHQIASAMSLGLSRWQIARYIVLPQAMTMAVPLVGANAIFLIKETSVVSVIAVSELMYLTKDIIGMTYKTYEALFLLTLSYLVILLPISFVLSKFERRVRYAALGV